MQPIAAESNAASGSGYEAVIGESVSFSHGKKHRKALDDVDISVSTGSIYALLGPSGCGKTTLLRCVSGYLKPKHGNILVFGRVPGENGSSIPGRDVGYMPQELSLYPEIEVQEMLAYFGKLYRMNRKEIFNRIEFLVSLLDIPNKKALIQNLSGGQKRRVSFAIALIHKPPLLLLDEPTVGVDPLLRESIWEYMKELAKEDGMTILITTHYVEEARQANMVGLMRKGRLMVQMEPEALMRLNKAITLEEVFLKLCRTDKESAGDESLKEVNATEPLKSKEQKPDDKEPELSMRLKDLEEEKSGLDTGASCSLDKSLRKRGKQFDLKAMSCLSRTDESFHRLLTLTGKNFLRLRRNIPLIVFEILVPLIQVVVFCLCIGGEPFDLPIAIVNHEKDPTAFGEKYLNSLCNKTFIKVRFDEMTPALRSVEVGETYGVVYIGPTFTESLINRYLDGIATSNETITGSEIYLYLDMTNQQVFSTIYSSVIFGFQSFSKEVLETVGYNPRLADPPVILKDPVYGSQDSSFREFMVPGMIIGINYMMSICLTAMSIIIERKEGLLERCIIAGVTSVEVVGSILLHLFVTMVVQAAIVLAISLLLFDIPILGSMSWVVICVLLVGLSGMAFGLFVSAVCRDENAAMMVAMGSFYPNFLLGGLMWPIEAMPQYLRYLSYALPMTQIARTMRSILSKGWSISDYGAWDGPLICTSWTIFFLIITCVVFKYKTYS